MPKVPLTALGCAALLASCAPTLTASTIGRIVNASTGEEGTVTFLPGALRARAGDPFGGNNTTVVIGGQTYGGRAALLDAAAAPPAPTAGLNLGLAFGSAQASADSLFGWGLALGTPSAPRTLLRSGNLIAKTAGTSPRTLTCTLQVDEQGHGIGDCTGNDGTRYAVQF